MPPRARSLWERMVDKFTVGGGCWEWTGAKAGRGYGYINGGSRGTGVKRAHIVLYELLVGPVPEGLELDHLCRNPGCVNPDHLEPVTHAENLARYGRTVTRCAQGHAYTPDNTVYWSGRRKCRECNRLSSQRTYQQRRLRLEGAI